MNFELGERVKCVGDVFNKGAIGIVSKVAVDYIEVKFNDREIYGYPCSYLEKIDLERKEGDLISRERLINEWDDLGRRYAMPTSPIHKRAIREFPSADVGENRWIPVSERLPEIHQDVLLSLRSLDIEVGFRAETEPYFYRHGVDACYIEPQNVLAWQPLPEPYKVESED